MSSDDGKRLLWLDFGEEDGEKVIFLVRLVVAPKRAPLIIWKLIDDFMSNKDYKSCSVHKSLPLEIVIFSPVNQGCIVWLNKYFFD